MTKLVYSFGDGKADGRAEMRDLLGGKGANLANCPISVCGAARFHKFDGRMHILLCE